MSATSRWYRLRLRRSSLLALESILCACASVLGMGFVLGLLAGGVAIAFGVLRGVSGCSL